MTSVYKTPTEEMGINVKPRQPKWNFHDVPVKWAGTPEKAAFMGALSLVAPVFEPFACRVLRAHLEMIQEPKLKKEARGFIGQESHHWKVHTRFNEQALGAHGWDTDHIQSGYTEAVSSIERTFDLQRQLAIIASGEHFLYFISMYLLDGDLMGDVHELPRLMFEWHALEEVEHTSIAYDVYQHIYGSSPRNYFERLKAMNSMISFLPSVLGEGYKQCLEQYDLALQKAGETCVSHSKGFSKLHLGASALTDVLRFYRPGFHPWKTHDKTHYLERMPAIEETFHMAS